MTLKELIDVSETMLVISEGDYSFPFLVLREMDSFTSEEFKDVLTPEMLSRKVESIKAGNEVIFVVLEEPER